MLIPSVPTAFVDMELMTLVMSSSAIALKEKGGHGGGGYWEIILMVELRTLLSKQRGDLEKN